MGTKKRTVPTRRVRRTDDPPRKMGWQVRTSVADAVRQAVEEGVAQSQNEFVERALVRELREIRRRRVYDAYAQAAADETFLSEMRAVTEAFDASSDDGLSGTE